MSLLIVCFWGSLVCIGYAYFGYPILIRLLARCFGRGKGRGEGSDRELPVLSLLIAAYNEEAVIEERIENALQLDYPRDKLEIVIATDGCSDRTADIVRRYASRGIRLLEYKQRRGKAAVLNSAFAEVRGEVVMLSDANTFTEPSAAKHLVRWFQDPTVGAVCGRLVLTDPARGTNVDSLYWKYETALKREEGRLGALLGANGGIYAIRKAHYVPIPNDTILDDLVIPLLARLRSGCGIVYEEAAVAHEETPAHVGAEFHRRSRIGAGGFGSLRLLAGLLNPRQGWIFFTFFSHKVMRWCCPFFLLGLLVSNILLVHQHPFYLNVLLAQVLFYATAILAPSFPRQNKVCKLLRLTTMFTGMNLALLAGFTRWLKGTQTVLWKRTARLAEAQAEVAVPVPSLPLLYSPSAYGGIPGVAEEGLSLDRIPGAETSGEPHGFSGPGGVLPPLPVSSEITLPGD